MEWVYESGVHNIRRVRNANFATVLAVAKERVHHSAHLRSWAQDIFDGEGAGEVQQEWLRYVATALDSEIINALCARRGQTMPALERIREYMGNQNVTLNTLGQVRLEETAQTLGVVFESEESVIEHLHILCMEQGNAWHDVDVSDLYQDPSLLREGLRYLGEGVWYQRY